jgi:hypothetical protein
MRAIGQPRERGGAIWVKSREGQIGACALPIRILTIAEGPSA